LHHVGDLFELNVKLQCQKVKDPFVPTKRVAVHWTEVKSCNATGIRVYIKSVRIYKFLILDSSQSDTLYLSEQECEDALLFCKAKRKPRAKSLENIALRCC
jgi:hypothetical protein